MLRPCFSSLAHGNKQRMHIWQAAQPIGTETRTACLGCRGGAWAQGNRDTCRWMQKLGEVGRVVVDNSRLQFCAGNPRPKLIHLELPKELASQRIIILGDVHGCDDELQNLLDKVKFRKGSDVLVFNGDIINKGPKSVQVWTLLYKLHAPYGVPLSFTLSSCVCLHASSLIFAAYAQTRPQVIDHIRALDGIVVRGNQDDKALAQYVAWKAGKSLVQALPVPWWSASADALWCSKLSLQPM